MPVAPDVNPTVDRHPQRAAELPQRLVDRAADAEPVGRQRLADHARQLRDDEATPVPVSSIDGRYAVRNAARRIDGR